MMRARETLPAVALSMVAEQHGDTVLLSSTRSAARPERHHEGALGRDGRQRAHAELAAQRRSMTDQRPARSRCRMAATDHSACSVIRSGTAIVEARAGQLGASVPALAYQTAENGSQGDVTTEGNISRD